MKALLYGSGAVGLAIAAALFDSGWELDIKASGSTADEIRKNGIKRIGLFKQISVPAAGVKVYEALSDITSGQYDYILISTKALANEENASDLNNNRTLLKNDGRIVIFQNGWGTDEPYLRYFDDAVVCNARVITGFSRPERYISEITVHASPIFLGNLHKHPVDSLKPLADAINQGGIPCEVTSEVQKALWAKMLYNCTLNPLGAVLGVPYGKLTECQNSISIMNKVIEEIFSVMKAAGYETYWDSAEAYKKDFYGELVPNTYNHRSSTLQDIERKIRTEIDTLNGSVVNLGNKFMIPVPVNEMLQNLIKTMESYF
ncbi:MAG: ketopantoate reductase family protein [Clostridiales bacterium]|nr:ketopantoate reductase family protein [Clostridiales bacterium]